MHMDKPWEFEINSKESRAAASAMLEARDQNMRWIEIRTNATLPHADQFPDTVEWRAIGEDTMIRIGKID